MTSASLVPASASVIAHNNQYHDSITQVTRQADDAREQQTLSSIQTPQPGSKSADYGLFTAVSGSFDTRA